MESLQQTWNAFPMVEWLMAGIAMGAGLFLVGVIRVLGRWAPESSRQLEMGGPFIMLLALIMTVNLWPFLICCVAWGLGFSLANLRGSTTGQRILGLIFTSVFGILVLGLVASALYEAWYHQWDPGIIWPAFGAFWVILAMAIVLAVRRAWRS
jgi:hypothetical protein